MEAQLVATVGDLLIDPRDKVGEELDAGDDPLKGKSYAAEGLFVVFASHGQPVLERVLGREKPDQLEAAAAQHLPPRKLVHAQLCYHYLFPGDHVEAELLVPHRLGLDLGGLTLVLQSDLDIAGLRRDIVCLLDLDHQYAPLHYPVLIHLLCYLLPIISCSTHLCLLELGLELLLLLRRLLYHALGMVYLLPAVFQVPKVAVNKGGRVGRSAVLLVEFIKNRTGLLGAVVLAIDLLRSLRRNPDLTLEESHPLLDRELFGLALDGPGTRELGQHGSLVLFKLVLVLHLVGRESHLEIWRVLCTIHI